MGINIILQSVFLSLAFAFAAYAQNGDTALVVKNGRRFKEITVAKGQTLYSLAKASGISQDTLIVFNRDLEKGLKAGMKVLIPMPVETKPVPHVNTSSIKHEVKAGETLFGIARMYGLTQDELTAQNPLLKAGLKTGMVLTIYPKPGTAVSEKGESSRTESDKSIQINSECEFADPQSKNNVSVSLVLPLYSSKDDNQIKSRTGLEFYAGCMLAIDSLKNTGLNIELNVFDTQSDSLAMNKVLKSDQLAKSDFVLGPLHASEFRQVSNQVSGSKTLVIAPLASSSALITGSSHAVKLIPDQKRLIDGLVDQVLKNYKNARYILIRNSNAKDKELSAAIALALSSRIDTTASNYLSVAYTGVNDLLEKLDSEKENILFFPSTAQVQVIDATARLNASRIGKRITLVGLNEWNNFENIDYEHLNNLNFIYAVPWYIDFNSDAAKKFRAEYRNEFKGEPGVYAFQGYDAMFYFIQAASRLKKLSANCLPDLPVYRGFCTEFKFNKENSTSGADNNHVFVLQLSDYLAAPINKP